MDGRYYLYILGLMCLGLLIYFIREFWEEYKIEKRIDTLRERDKKYFQNKKNKKNKEE